MGEYYGVRRKDDDSYIEHWGVPKGWTKQGHNKYLARLVSASGKGYRYIYSQAELAAAKAGKLAGNASKTVRKSANNVGKSIAKATGLTARNRAQATAARANRYTNPSGRGQSQPNPRDARMARATAKRAQNAYNKTLLGRAENAFNSASKAVRGAASDVSKQANKAYKTARQGVMDAGRNAQNYVNKQVNKAKKTYNDYQNFKKLPQWQKDMAAAADRKGIKKVMGRNVSGAAMASRLEGIENSIRRATGNARRTVNNAVDNVSRGANDAYRTARRAVNDTWDNVQRGANDAYRTAKRTVRDTKRNVAAQTKRTIRSTSVGRGIDDTVGLTKQGRHNKRNAAYKQDVLDRREINAYNPNYSKKRKQQIKRKRSKHMSGSF